MSDVSIIVPVFGPEHFLTACLSAIKSNTIGHELILVDNATGYDMSANVVIRNDANKGFAIACNQGANAATSDILLFLNVDTEVQSGWLPPLLATFDDHEIAMVGPKIIHPDQSLQSSGIRTWHGNGNAGGEELKDDSPSRDVDGVTGACMAIRRGVFNSVGGFHEGYWNGYDDVDLCLTVRSLDHRIRYVAESTIVHHESATGPERWTHCYDNIALMNQRWGAR